MDDKELRKQLFILLRWVVVIAAFGVFLHFGWDPGILPPPPSPVAAPVTVNIQPGADAPVVETTPGDFGYGFQTKVYMTDGGDKLKVTSGGEIELDSGATLDMDGTTEFATLTVAGAAALNGGITADTTAFTVADTSGNVGTTGTLNVDGAVTLNSTVDIDGNISSGTGVVTVTDAVNVGVDGTGYDVNFYSSTAGDLMLWDASEEGLYITGTAAQDALDIVDGNVDIADDIDVDGTANLDVVDIDGTLNVAGAATLASDVTLTASGGNAGAVTEYVGVPKLSMVIGSAGTDGSITVDAIDTTPTGEWAEVDAGTNVLVTADTSIYRATTNSVKVAFTAVAENDGVDGTIAQTDFTAYESVGFWIYATSAVTAADLDLTLDDTNGTDQVYTLPAIPATTWTYVELDISGCDANCDTTDGIHVLWTAQAAAYGVLIADIYIDAMYVWDADDEEALGVAIVDDGVIGVMVMVTATGGNRIPLPAVEYTSWVTHYESGNDFIVYLDNQSGNSVWALVAVE
jgi:hypothetical protein